MSDATLFYLKVVSREGPIYDGRVLSITSYNEKGKFDVLVSHANFISLISRGVEIVEMNGNSKQLNFDNALLRVKSNLVEVYIGVEGMGPLKYPSQAV